MVGIGPKGRMIFFGPKIGMVGNRAEGSKIRNFVLKMENYDFVRSKSDRRPEIRIVLRIFKRIFLKDLLLVRKKNWSGWICFVASWCH